MPVVIIMRSPTLRLEQRDELAARANLLGDPPEGLLLHVHADNSEEVQLSVEVWETTEFHERFLHERMLPAAKSLAADASLGLPEQDSPEIVATVCVTRPGIVTTLVDDMGNEVRKVTER